jgi:hypothetical protein
MRARIIAHWMDGLFPFTLLLLVLTPLVAKDWPTWQLTLWLMIPGYMLHQIEEHDDDRFRRFLNSVMFGGRDGLSAEISFVVNVIGVWGGLAAVLWLAVAVHPGFGVISIWLMLVNAAVHLLTAIWLRGYNPGLMTAMTLFPGLAAYGLWALPAGLWDHVLGLGVAIAGHLAIQLAVRRRLARLDP